MTDTPEPARPPINKRWSFYGGPLVAAALGLLCTQQGLSFEASATAGMTGLMALWWVFEPVPIAATSLIPFFALPLLGILDYEEVSRAYGHHLVLLMLGGSMISTAMENSGAHRRLALGMVYAVGGHGGRRMVLGFMIATCMLSMWISNVATTLMLMPVAIAIIQQAERKAELAVPLLLGLTYAASIGGIGTLIGTPPNLVFHTNYAEVTGINMTFIEWMSFGVPVMLMKLPLAWLWITRGMRGSERLNVPHPGPWQAKERRVMVIFGLTALCWITRTDPFGGWGGWLGERLAWLHGSAEPLLSAGDSTVALAATVAMFLIPDGEGSRLLTWDTARRIPWDLLLLVGSGVLLSDAFEAAGLAALISSKLSVLSDWPVLLTIVVTCLVVTFITEISSNTATANLVMPMLGGAAQAAGIDPALLMIPGAIACSLGFMLPVATLPNAVVFSTGFLSARTMARQGFVMNVLGVVIVTLYCYWRFS